MSVASPSRLRSARVPAGIPDQPRPATIPGFIEPSHPTERQHAPEGREWIHEVKFDGHRVQVRRSPAGVTVFTRNGLDWTDQFAAIARAAERLQASSFIIDGEAIVEDANGIADWHALKRSLGSVRVRCYAFDLLYLDGFDLRQAPLIARKRALAKLLDGDSTLLLAEDFERDGAELFEAGCRMGLEGIVSKKRDAPYHSGRVESWIKVKCKKSDALPIVAFVEKLGAKPRRIASLYVGRRENGKLLYAGKVQTGYTLKAAQEIRERLDPFITRVSPLNVPVKKPKATWLKPKVLAEVEYSAVTEDGLLRAAVFKGLRDDLALPRRRSPPTAPKAPRVGVPRENILQLLPDAAVPSKEELTRYWKKVGSRALKYLGHRPLKLVRHTHGTTFYHKGRLPTDIPPAVHQLRIHKREGGEGTRLWVDSVAGLLGLVEIGAVELHPWNAIVADYEHADQVVIDLDPGDGVEWKRVIEAALRMRALMTAEGLRPWPKLTGGKGVHLVAPLAARMTNDAAHRYARRLVGELAKADPAHYILGAQTDRRGRIFLDYLRNGRGTTAVGTYSPRVRAGFPIAAPVTWAMVEAGVPPDAFTMENPFLARSTARRSLRRQK
jgi:bifunctional non-homologous end joining protein LigD